MSEYLQTSYEAALRENVALAAKLARAEARLAGAERQRDDAMALLTKVSLRKSCEGTQPYICHGLATARAQLAEAVECCTIKDNRNLRLEAKVADLERQLHWALTGDMPTDSASGGAK